MHAQKNGHVSEVLGARVPQISIGGAICSVLFKTMLIKCQFSEETLDLLLHCHTFTVSFHQQVFALTDLWYVMVISYSLKAVFVFFIFFFFYLGFLSRPFMNHRTAGEERGHFFNSSLTFPNTIQTLRY